MTRTTRVGATAALSVAAMLFAGRALAQKPSAECRAEIEKLCPGLKPGDGKYGQCVIDHKADLSDPCKKYADAAAARKQDLKQFPACIADAERLCPNTPLALSRLTKCLRTHQSDLSPECKQEIGKRSGKVH